MKSINHKLANTIAERLHRWMADDLASPEEPWVVHPKHFLPANVTTDYAGVRGFINAMANRIAEELDNVPK